MDIPTTLTEAQRAALVPLLDLLHSVEFAETVGEDHLNWTENDWIADALEAFGGDGEVIAAWRAADAEEREAMADAEPVVTANGAVL